MPPRPITSSTTQPPNSVPVSRSGTEKILAYRWAVGTRSHAAGAFACAALLAACGTAAPPPQRPIALQIAAPADGVRVSSTTIRVSGTVSPAGVTLTVLGRPVPVRHGTFSTRVPLLPGTNIIDVLAGAPNSRAAMTAVRVVRYVVVAIPDLGGESASQASDALTAIGLVPRVHTSPGGFFDFLLPISPQVCSTTPNSGRSVPLGTTVTVNVAKVC
jgi:hypothetical protein